MTLRDKIIRLAYAHPELRDHLLPFVSEEGSDKSASSELDLDGIEAYTHSIHAHATELTKIGVSSLRRIDSALKRGDLPSIQKEVDAYLSEVDSKVASMRNHSVWVKDILKYAKLNKARNV